MSETTTFDDMSKQRRNFLPGLIKGEADVLLGFHEDGNANWAHVEGYGPTKNAARAQLFQIAAQMQEILDNA